MQAEDLVIVHARIADGTERAKDGFVGRMAKHKPPILPRDARRQIRPIALVRHPQKAPLGSRAAGDDVAHDVIKQNDVFELPQGRSSKSCLVGMKRVQLGFGERSV